MLVAGNPPKAFMFVLHTSCFTTAKKHILITQAVKYTTISIAMKDWKILFR